MTMHCHLCRTVMPARVLAEHPARQHPDPDHQVEWVDGTPGPVLVLEPSDFGGVR